MCLFGSSLTIKFIWSFRLEHFDKAGHFVKNLVGPHSWKHGFFICENCNWCPFLETWPFVMFVSSKTQVKMGVEKIVNSELSKEDIYSTWKATCEQKLWNVNQAKNLHKLQQPEKIISENHKIWITIWGTSLKIYFGRSFKQPFLWKEMHAIFAEDSW